MRLSASIRRTEATQANVNNALSMLETQDGVLKTAEKVLSRMSELAQLATDVTKSTNDTALYQKEVDSLASQLGLMLGEEFNGVALFTDGGGTTITTDSVLSVVTSEDGSQLIDISRSDLGAVTAWVGSNAADAIDISSAIGVATAAITAVTAAIQNLAKLRASNGSEQVRLTFAGDMLAVNKTNLEAANSRIMDVDIAAESANLAKLNILQQAGTAMLAQANQSSQSLLRLLV
jgi:flagellin